MIEQLDIIRDSENCVDAFGDTHNVAGHKVINKINELVGAVNKIMTWRFETDDEPAENPIISKMENVDPYAEQRKWIGKLCRFWDTDIGENVWGILGGIDYSENEKYPYWCEQLQEQYQNCEPVKPDDDIIYKGGNTTSIFNPLPAGATTTDRVYLELELDRTRKALEKAQDWLEQVATLEKCDDDLCREFTKRKLTEIKTALEQKDVK